MSFRFFIVLFFASIINCSLAPSQNTTLNIDDLLGISEEEREISTDQLSVEEISSDQKKFINEMNWTIDVPHMLGSGLYNTYINILNEAMEADRDKHESFLNDYFNTDFLAKKSI